MAKINTEYDVGSAFEAIEEELISSMIRNMERHKLEEIEEDKQWSMWQAEQLKALEKYRKQNKKKFGKEFKEINKKIDRLILGANEDGQMDQEAEILKAIKKGFPAKKVSRGGTAEFFKVNDRKLNALLEATSSDMQKAESAVLRRANDQYRKVIFNAQVYANTGAGTYEKAVDMATKDFLSAGIDCIEYANGSRHTIADYADMAIRTASKRAYLQGEGTKRQEWGLHLVIMNKRGCPCPKCLPFVGKIMIDDVWSGGSSKDGKYPLMSSAIAAGLYHPRCRDVHTTYFPGITTVDPKYNKQEITDIEDTAKREAKQQYAKRQEKRFERLAKHSLDSENQRAYKKKQKDWQTVIKQEEIEDVKSQLKDLEKQFDDITEGYSYDDFMKDFESVEEGFEGASEEEIKRAKEIDKKIKSLREKINSEKQVSKKMVRTKEESIQAFEGLGIDFKDNSTGISDATLNKFVEFAEKFEQEHSGYFVKNKLQLKSLSVVDDLSENGVTAAGAYYSDSQSIKLMKKAIETKPTSKLFTYSRSDDYAMHFFAHEYGHYIADSLSKKLSITDYDIIQKSLLKYFDGDIFKTKTSNLVDVLGSYGSENAQEAFAEAFAEAYTCKEPGRFASIFKEELEKVLDVSLEKKATSDIMVSGARITDIFSKEADEFAEMYYKEIRSFSTDAKKIAENLNKKESDIRKIKSYLFEDKSLLDTDTGEWRRFDPDCAIAQSWQRLMIGKDIKPHDKTLIEHELLEMKIKKENPNMEHWKAHEIASEKYDYPKEATEYYGNLEKHKKNK